MRKIILTAALVCCSLAASAQEMLKISSNQWGDRNIPITEIDSITYSNDNEVFNVSKTQFQRYIIIHKGKEKIVYPLEEIDSISTWRQIVNDKYIRISYIYGTIKEHGIYMNVSTKINNDSCGIIWSTTPEPTIENGNLANRIKISDGNTGEKSILYRMPTEETIKHDTPYYFRAFFTEFGTTYYSEVKEHIFRRTLKELNIALYDATPYKICGYAMPTDNAFAEAYRELMANECTDATLQTLKNLWFEFIAPEIVESIDKSDAEHIICHECDLYMLNSVPKDFMKCILDIDKSTFVGLDDYYKLIYCNISKIECPESFGVYNNHYWQLTGVASTSNPAVILDLPESLQGYTYNINMVFAFESHDNGMPNKVYYEITDGDDSSIYKSETTVLDNATKCDTLSYELEATHLKNIRIKIASGVGRRETGYSRKLRIVGVFVERKKK